MASSAVHKWKTLDTVAIDGVRFFKYQCSRCKVTTLNGKAIPAPYNKECTPQKKT